MVTVVHNRILQLRTIYNGILANSGGINFRNLIIKLFCIASTYTHEIEQSDRKCVRPATPASCRVNRSEHAGEVNGALLE